MVDVPHISDFLQSVAAALPGFCKGISGHIGFQQSGLSMHIFAFVFCSLTDQDSRTLCVCVCVRQCFSVTLEFIHPDVIFKVF